MTTLREARAKHNITQQELAEATGLSHVTISNIETLKAEPRPATRRRIEVVLGNVDWGVMDAPLSKLEKKQQEVIHNFVNKKLGPRFAELLFDAQSPRQIRGILKVFADKIKK